VNWAKQPDYKHRGRQSTITMYLSSGMLAHVAYDFTQRCSPGLEICLEAKFYGPGVEGPGLVLGFGLDRCLDNFLASPSNYAR